MEIQEYIDQKKKLQNLLLDFIDNENDIDIYYQNLIGFFDLTKLFENRGELREFLHLISTLLKYHHRSQNFFQKFEKIILHLKNEIKQTFSNFELFLIMKGNKRFLHLLFKNKIINIDQKIVNFFIDSKKNYCLYFYPEIKDFLDEKLRAKIENDFSSIENFEKQRETDENNNYLCTLIRNDSVIDFISYVNKTVLSLSTKIHNSIFETNKLLQNKPSLIEYAAFYGSIQIVKYLLLNNAKITSFLFICAICGRNPELIHLLEETDEFNNQNILAKQLIMSIQCHHNEITEYIVNNYIKMNNENNTNFIYLFAFHYNNYSLFPSSSPLLNNVNFFDYSCEFGYFKLVDYFLNSNISAIDDDRIITKDITLAAKKNKIEIVDLFLKNVKFCKFQHYLFKNCNIIKITIPSSVEEIDEFAFDGCLYLNEVIFESPSSLTTINIKAFQNCKSLAQISIPSSVTEIDIYAFQNCTSLTSINLPLGINIIKCSLFYNCSSLFEITIPNSIKIIEKYAFNKCYSLKEIIIPSSVTEILSNSFSECKSLVRISIPSSVTQITSYLFNGCSSLVEVIIPSSVVKIMDYAFCGCSSLKEIQIPSSVTNIGRFAFRDCSSLLSIAIPPSVESIQYGTFQSCSSLVGLTISSSTIFNDSYIFAYCSSLKEIIIPSTTISIPYYAFIKCTSLEKVTIPPSVVTIKEYAFSECSSLKELAIPSSVKKIESYAFSYCSSLINVTLPSSIEVIKCGCFLNCSSLIEIIIPSSLRSIENYCFFKCTSLVKVIIPSSVISIRSNSFNGCSSLKEIMIPPSVISIERFAFYKCSSLEKVQLNCSATSISESVFDHCSSLKEIKIPPSVTEIRNYAFSQCISLSNVSFSKSLKRIGQNAFYGCTLLDNINIPNSSVEIDINAFPEKTKIFKGNEKCHIY